MKLTAKKIEQQFRVASQRYADLGVDAAKAIKAALKVPISLHCWQADDVTGLEHVGDISAGGIMATGNYPGKARNGDEIRADMSQVLALLPGTQRFNIHAFYAETSGKPVDRSQITPRQFSRWLDWARQEKIGLDFNPTYFAHPKAADGFTLSHPDKAIRQYWIAHGIASRKIAAHFGRALQSPAVNNHWIPDGTKDYPADRWSPRQRLVESLDAILSSRHGISAKHCVDAVEGKLFGLGSEEYVVGSSEFYSNYALSRGVVLCLDMGHFHPTETIHDKLSAHLSFHNKLLLHTSRPIRWDSDHVVLFNDDVRHVFLELARGKAFDRVYVALDFFDASINRLAAYVIGARSTRKAILYAMLDPTARLQACERRGQNAQRLALMEEAKTLPFGAVWDMACLQSDVPVGTDWIGAVESYEKTVLATRA
jgi:L-rhamnose isomerase